MNQELLPPHLKIAETVTDKEYATAKWQNQLVLLSALMTGIAVTGGLALFVTGMLKSLVGGGLFAIGVERLLDQIFPHGKKMRTQRMKVYPELQNFRKRQGK